MITFKTKKTVMSKDFELGKGYTLTKSFTGMKIVWVPLKKRADHWECLEFTEGGMTLTTIFLNDRSEMEEVPFTLDFTAEL